jgi:hypothetical protein
VWNIAARTRSFLAGRFDRSAAVDDQSARLPKYFL